MLRGNFIFIPTFFVHTVIMECQILYIDIRGRVLFAVLRYNSSVTCIEKCLPKHIAVYNDIMIRLNFCHIKPVALVEV